MRLGTVVMVLLLGLLAACRDDRPIPPELVDVWTTSAPAYRDRVFEVREGWVVFGTGKHSRSIFEIEGVESQPESEGRVRHTLHYWTQEGERFALQLIFHPGRSDSLRIGHRDEIWVRQRDADWLEEES